MASKMRVTILLALLIATTIISPIIYFYLDKIIPIPGIITMLVLSTWLVWGIVESVKLIKEKQTIYGTIFLFLNAFCVSYFVYLSQL